MELHSPNVKFHQQGWAVAMLMEQYILSVEANDTAVEAEGVVF